RPEIIPNSMWPPTTEPELMAVSPSSQAHARQDRPRWRSAVAAWCAVTEGNDCSVALLSGWPATADELIAWQEELTAAEPPQWQLPVRPVVAGCFACFSRGYLGIGRAGEPGWAAGAAYDGKHRVASSTFDGRAGAPYLPGLLALRLGALLENATRA